MIAALAALAAVTALSLLVTLALVRLLGQERTAAATERAQLVRAVIAKNASEAIGLEAAARPRRSKQAAPVDPDNDPPPGTQPIGLDGF